MSHALQFLEGQIADSHGKIGSIYDIVAEMGSEDRERIMNATRDIPSIMEDVHRSISQTVTLALEDGVPIPQNILELMGSVLQKYMTLVGSLSSAMNMDDVDAMHTELGRATSIAKEMETMWGRVHQGIVKAAKGQMGGRTLRKRMHRKRMHKRTHRTLRMRTHRTLRMRTHRSR